MAKFTRNQPIWRLFGKQIRTVEIVPPRRVSAGAILKVTKTNGYTEQYHIQRQKD